LLFVDGRASPGPNDLDRCNKHQLEHLRQLDERCAECQRRCDYPQYCVWLKPNHTGRHVSNVFSITVNTGGRLTVSATATLTFNSSGMLNRGTVNNNGTITINSAFTGLQYGLANLGTFNHNSGAILQIGAGSTAGVLNETGATFDNSGQVNLVNGNSSRTYGIL
jgi:hypothetical protein